jgi:hypothetical protein
MFNSGESPISSSRVRLKGGGGPSVVSSFLLGERDRVFIFVGGYFRLQNFTALLYQYSGAARPGLPGLLFGLDLGQNDYDDR